MKFVSWNVNGLRACIQKGFLDYFNEMDADFFCLQETKLSEGQLQLSLPGYEQYWCYAEKKGYSGTAIFTKHTPLSVSYGIGVPELDTEGRVITLEYQEFYLVTCYTPNAQRGLARLDHRMKWDESFRSYLKNLDECKPVIVCGDLNVAHKEIDLKNPASNRGNAGFSDEERESFQNTLDTGFTDTFRHLYPDATGKYSWWSYMYNARENNAGWRIDYFLVSDRLQRSIERADIHSHVMGSDHCPVTLDLDTMVNGSIWSPSVPGKATVIEPEKKKSNKAKASAVPAKALVTFGLLFALFLTGVIIFPLLFDHAVTPFDPPEDFSPFAVTDYDLPFYKSIPDGTGITIETLDAEEKFYLDPAEYEASASMENANTFLKVELTEEGLPYAQAGWKLVTEGHPPAVSFVQMAILNNNLACVKYYADPELTQFQGWLIWAETFGEKEFILHFADGDGEYRHSERVSFTTYLSQQKADQLSTMELLRHIMEHPHIEEILATPLINGMTDAEYCEWIMEDTRCSVYPAYTELLTRGDAVNPLLHSDFGNNKWLNYALLHHAYLRSFMTPEQEVAYLTGQYENCPVEYISTGEAFTDDMDLTALFTMFRNSPSANMLQFSSSAEVAQQIVNYLSNYDPVFKTLSIKDNLISSLMVMKEGKETYSSHLINRLLYYSPFCYMMTPYEEFLYLTCRYPNCTLMHETPVYYGANSTSLSTEELLVGISNLVANDSAFRRSNSDACLYYVYWDMCQNSPEFYDLMHREDLEAVLKPKAEEQLYGITLMDSYVNVYKQLWRLHEYIEENGELNDLTTKELVHRFVSDPTMEALWANVMTYYENDSSIADRFFGWHPIIQLLNLREDAVSAILLYENEQKSMIPYDLLITKTIWRRMTPEEEALFLSGAYPSAPEVAFDNLSAERAAEWSTPALASWLDEQDHIVQALTGSSDPSVVEQVYRLLAKECPAMQELMNRSDVITVLLKRAELYESVYIYRLLETNLFRGRMSPYEEASYLMLLNNGYNFPVLPDVDIDGMDTQTLLEEALSYSNVELIMQCSSAESMYYIYQDQILYNPCLQALMQREDLPGVLRSQPRPESKPEDSSYNITVFDCLMWLHQYILELDA